MKLIRFTTFATCALSLMLSSNARADWASVVAADAPLHWFAFEETEGTTADDAGSANVDGTYTGAVGLGGTGLVGKAASFDGASHVFVGGPDLTGDWTLESIFKADTANGGASMGLIGTDFTAASRMAVKAEQWNSTETIGYTVFGVVDVTLTGAATPTDFAHVVLVGQAGGVEVFVNGTSVGSDATATNLARYVIGAGAIREDGTLVDGLTGMIDELVIYDKALTPEQIATHAAMVPEPASCSLVLMGLLGLVTRRRR